MYVRHIFSKEKKEKKERSTTENQVNDKLH